MREAAILRLNPAADAILPPDAAVERIASGFLFTEGPLWLREGALLFSDIPANTIYRWHPNGGVSVFRRPSGFDGTGASDGAFIGSNGLTLDAAGRLVVCEHGNRRVTRVEADGSLTVLASHWNGRRLNSPNDVVFHSSGGMYFTDPPYGLPGEDSDPQKELDFNGVYRFHEGELQLLHRNMSRPNGLAFSPDERFLYVANSDPERKIWNRFPVREDGTLGDPEVFAGLTASTKAGLPDGMKMDTAGNLYCTGPGGTHILDAQGNRLGVIVTPEIPANLNWGEADGRTLYLTARTSVYRIRLNATGIRPAAC
jgi:gluconolactonase